MLDDGTSQEHGVPPDPKTQALDTLAAICQEYVNVLLQTGKQLSANLVAQATNQSVQILREKATHDSSPGT